MNLKWVAVPISIVCFAISLRAQVPLSSYSFSIPDRGGTVLLTDGSTFRTTTGYAVLNSAAFDLSPAAVAIAGFRQNNVLVSETVFPSSRLILSGSVLVEMTTAIRTGLVFANPGPTDASVSFSLTDESGVTAGGGRIILQARTQIARFLNEENFSFAGSFKGVFTFTFSSSAPVAVSGVRGRTNERLEFLMSTLPVFDAGPATGEALLPHFADGGGWSTRVALINLSTETVSGTVQFSSRDADLSDVSYTLPPRGLRLLQTPGASPSTRSGFVRVIPRTNSATPAAFATFSFRNEVTTVSEASVVPMPAGAAFRVYAEAVGNFNDQEAGSVQTALAIVNPGADAVVARLELTDLDGKEAVAGTLTIPGNGQMASFIGQLLPALMPPFRGVLRISTSSLSGLFVTSLRGHYNERRDFLISVLPSANENDARTGTFVLPQIVDGAGYSTEVVLFSASGETRRSSIDFLMPVTITGQGIPSVRSVRNAAAPERIYVGWGSPGAILSIRGAWLTSGVSASAPGVAADHVTAFPSGALPTRLAGTRILVRGVPAPLLFASPELINFQLPFEATPVDNYGYYGLEQFQVELNTQTDRSIQATFSIGVTRFNVGIYTLNGDGTGPALIRRVKDGSLICPTGRTDCKPSSAAQGEAIDIYATGLGLVNGPVRTGEPASAAYHATTTFQVWIGGSSAPVLSSELVPGAVGLYRFRAVIPYDTAVGNNVTLISTSYETPGLDPVSSNGVTIAVHKPDRQPQPGTGPPGGSIRVIAIDPIDPRYIFAAASGAGVFRSDNGGTSWDLRSSGLTDLDFTSLVIDPADSTVLYLATDGHGVFKTVDRGQTWATMNDGLSSLNVSALGIHALDRTLFAATPDGPFRSTNRGATWSAAENFPRVPYTDYRIRILAVHPKRPVVIAGAGYGLFSTSDGGKTWMAVPRTYEPYTGNFNQLMFDPSGSLLFAASSEGVFVSANEGRNWTKTSAPSRLLALAIDPLQSSILYAGTEAAGIWKSSNGGLEWSLLSVPGSSISSLAIDPRGTTTVFAGSLGGGILKSRDSGQSWTAVNAGLTVVDIRSIARNPQNPSVNLVGTSSMGIFRSSDGGVTWTSVAPESRPIASLVFDPGNTSIVYAAGCCNHILKSMNGGQTWKEIEVLSHNVSYLVVRTLAIDPTNTRVLYAGLSNAGGYEGVVKSVDGGETWAPSGVRERDVYAIAVDGSGSVYAAAAGTIFYGSSGVYVSRDAGATWERMDAGLADVSALALDLASPSTLYAGGCCSVFKSADWGRSWGDLGLSPYFVNTIALDVRTPGVIYAGTQRHGLFKSSDSGRTWQESGLPTMDVFALTIDPTDPTTIYAGTQSGLFTSTDAGVTWQPSAGPPSTTKTSRSRLSRSDMRQE